MKSAVASRKTLPRSVVQSVSLPAALLSPHLRDSRFRELSRVGPSHGVNTDGTDSAVHTQRSVKNNRMVHFLSNMATQTQTGSCPSIPTDSFAKSTLELFKFLSKNASGSEIAKVRPTIAYVVPRPSVEKHQTVGSVLVLRPPTDVKRQQPTPVVRFQVHTQLFASLATDF